MELVPVGGLALFFPRGEVFGTPATSAFGADGAEDLAAACWERSGGAEDLAAACWERSCLAGALMPGGGTSLAIVKRGELFPRKKHDCDIQSSAVFAGTIVVFPVLLDSFLKKSGNRHSTCILLCLLPACFLRALLLFILSSGFGPRFLFILSSGFGPRFRRRFRRGSGRFRRFFGPRFSAFFFVGPRRAGRRSRGLLFGRSRAARSPRDLLAGVLLISGGGPGRSSLLTGGGCRAARRFLLQRRAVGFQLDGHAPPLATRSVGCIHGERRYVLEENENYFVYKSARK